MSNLTKQNLADAFRRQLERKTVDRITVTDIVRECGVDRHTFYYHFRDLYDLMSWIFLEDARRAVGGNKTPETWKAGLQGLFDYLRENRSLVMNACRSVNRPDLERYVESVTRPVVRSIASAAPGSGALPPERLDYIVDLYTYGLVGISLQWVARGMPGTGEETVELFLKLLDGSMETAVKKLS